MFLTTEKSEVLTSRFSKRLKGLLYYSPVIQFCWSFKRRPLCYTGASPPGGLNEVRYFQVKCML